MRWSHCLFSESSLCSKIMLKGNKGRGDPGEVAVAEETRHGLGAGPVGEAHPRHTKLQSPGRKNNNLTLRTLGPGHGAPQQHCSQLKQNI